MTTVQHRLLDTTGKPIAHQDVTILLMVRKDILRDGYHRDAPMNDSFNGGAIASQAVSTSDAQGYLSWELVPNEQIVPSGTYYQVAGLGPERTLLWVHASAAPVQLAECKLDLIDFNSTNLVVMRGPRGESGDTKIAARQGFFDEPVTDGDTFSVQVVSCYGLDDAGNAYYDPAGADPGEAAILTINDIGELALARPTGDTL